MAFGARGHDERAADVDILASLVESHQGASGCPRMRRERVPALCVDVVEVFNLGHAFQVIPEAGTSEVEVQPKLGPRETGEVRMHWRILVRHLREDG